MEKPVLLTDEQIEYLFRFCRKHYIHYYDVQVELVDHLANGIEEIWSKEPQRNFESALEKVYLAFGGYKGLQRVQEQKRSAVEKSNRRLKWNLFLEYFRWPKLWFTLCLFLISYTITQQADKRFLQIILPVIIAATFIWHLKTIWKHQHKIYKKQKDLLLLQSYESVPFLILQFTMFDKLAGFIIDGIFPAWSGSTINTTSFIFIFSLYVISINCYKEYLQKIYTTAAALYPVLFKEKVA